MSAGAGASAGEAVVDPTRAVTQAALPWAATAACKGRADLFFAPHGERPPARARRELAAREVCDACAVRVPCRAHARLWGEYGVWGGESEDEREEAGYLVSVAINRRARRRRR
ncbi:hypothetical protein BH20ACT2_BH20ACT2_12450 [soil metagenome]